MRFLSGLIFGVLITIGAAYLHDAAAAPSMSGPDSSGKRMVNWDVVGRSFDKLGAEARNAFDSLTGHGRSTAPEAPH